MLIFDKRNTSYTIIATLSDKPITAGNAYVLKFEDRFTNKTYELNLLHNVSAYPERYYKFIVTGFADYPESTYNYSIVERHPSTSADIQTLEVGLLKVIGTPVNEFIELSAPESSDDFLVYGNI